MVPDQFLRSLEIGSGLFRSRLRRRDLGGALFRGRLSRANLRAAQFEVCLEQVQIGPRRVQGRSLLLQLDRQIARVNLHQQIPGLHRLIALDGDLLDLAGNLRRDGNDIAIQERIVRGFMRQALRQVAQAEEQQPEEHQCPNDHHRPSLPK